MLDWLVSLLLAACVTCGAVLLAYNILPIFLYLLK